MGRRPLLSRMRFYSQEQGALKWKFALISGFVIGKKPYFKQMKWYVTNYWHDVNSSPIYLHVKGYFLFGFSSAEDRDRVLDIGSFSLFLSDKRIGSFSLNYKHFPLKIWKEDFVSKEEMVRVTPLGVRFPNLPLDFQIINYLC